MTYPRPTRAKATPKRTRLWERAGGRCGYCGDAITVEETTPDHVLPRCKGGSSAAHNIRAACMSCNCAKRDRDIEEFRWARRVQISAYGGILNGPQARALIEKGVVLQIPDYRFWFEVSGGA